MIALLVIVAALLVYSGLAGLNPNAARFVRDVFINMFWFPRLFAPWPART